MYVILIKWKNKVCAANYEGSMVVWRWLEPLLCELDLNKLGLCYVQYLGDGNFKGFAAVLQNKPCGNNVNIAKLECVGHVQKRVGARLRRLKRDMKDKYLVMVKGLEEKKDLADCYYGQSTRKNLTNVEDMRKAIWASYFRMISTDANPQHFRCPSEAVMTAIKPVFNYLSKIYLLRRVSPRENSKSNESFNSIVWQRLPKTVYNGPQTLKLDVSDAVVCFYEGYVAKANVLER
ncbi:hypothetical protein PR048_007491 [Dryococelus australis]|uniref:Mutator-like transposase domain-containing protein n=1 Tax=Dryococelus australis TaxID=614101 RepID=A0ABQ9HVA1_9NEOP|nr:hypothetical protein PR048_007491 [Dryococelus australis]